MPPRAIDEQAVRVAEQRMFDSQAERQAQQLLGAVCDLTRVKMVRALLATPLAASDLARVIGKTRSATSQHLRILREMDAVTAERKGNVVRYRINGNAAARFLSHVSEAFDRLAA